LLAAGPTLAAHIAKCCAILQVGRDFRQGIFPVLDEALSAHGQPGRRTLLLFPSSTASVLSAAWTARQAEEQDAELQRENAADETKAADQPARVTWLIALDGTWRQAKYGVPDPRCSSDASSLLWSRAGTCIAGTHAWLVCPRCLVTGQLVVCITTLVPVVPAPEDPVLALLACCGRRCYVNRFW
jgi:hypothetical protein